MAHLSPLFAPQFVATKSEDEIARRLREDEALVDAGRTCSWAAWHLPKYDAEQGKAIASHLAPFPGLSDDIKRTIYENLLNKLLRHLHPGTVPSGDRSKMQQEQGLLLPSELATALQVITHLQQTATIQRDTPAEAIVSVLRQKLGTKVPTHDFPDIQTASSIPKPLPKFQKRLCYICRLVIANPYPSHPSLCIPCGTFNYASSSLSMPPRLILPLGFTALITGARLNLGYHTALRLLRCGGRVIATTRYPRDAVVRYLMEHDAGEWKERLRVVGADFRSAADTFALVHEAKLCLAAWTNGKEARLDALINNAAQTLTDSVNKEELTVRQEEKLRREIGGTGLLIEGLYKARIRGGGLPSALGGTDAGMIAHHGSLGKTEAANPGIMNGVGNENTAAEIEPYMKSSWVQSLSEIPYEDVMSAHAVNSFVPLILIRELLPIMGCIKSESSQTSTKPQGYIINVSSREGIFEYRTKSAAKGGKHVHTNMSKAALNMITETEAAKAWQSRRVAMTTVDPGYMSAAPEYEDAFDGVRPVGWEDGAGRVLWPLAVGEIEGHATWGRFLKHYGAVDVGPGAGRG